MYILELRRGWPLKTRFYSSMLGLWSSYKGQCRKVHEAWQGNMDVSRGDTGDPGSLSGWHSDIGIPINFQEESGIVTFCIIELCMPLEVSKGYEASCPYEAGT